MGKRKTRKRSRRSKKGGLSWAASAALRSANVHTLCVWYGEGNDKSCCPKDKYKNKTDNHKKCGQLKLNDIEMVAHESSKMHDTPEMIPDIIEGGTLGFSGLDKNQHYNIYTIKHEDECKHGGQRYELFELANGQVEMDPESNITALVTSNNTKIKVEKEQRGTYHLNLDAGMLGSADYPKVEQDSFYFVPVSQGGKKKRKRRRRRTKKRRRKSKRRSTKKRRRRR